MDSKISIKCKSCNFSCSVEDAHKYFTKRKGRDANTLSGWVRYCFDCRKKHRIENKEKISLNKKKYYLKHKEYICDYKKEYYKKNLEEIRINQKERRRQNLPQILEKRKEQKLAKCLTEEQKSKLLYRRWVEGLSKEMRSLYDRFKVAEQSSANRKIEFSLSFEDVVNQYNSQKGKCFYTNKELTHDGGRWDASIDRLDSNKGYSKDNIRICSKQVNLMKHISNIEEFVELCRLVVKTHG